MKYGTKGMAGGALDAALEDGGEDYEAVMDGEDAAMEEDPEADMDAALGEEAIAALKSNDGAGFAAAVRAIVGG